MGKVCAQRLSGASERNGALDVTQRPQREGEVQRRCRAKVLAEVECQIIVAPRLGQGQGTFEMLPRFTVLSSEPMCSTGGAMSAACLGRIGSRLDVAEKGLAWALIDDNSPRT
jgi:hypothetical protein